MNRVNFLQGETVSLVLPEEKDLERIYHGINNIKIIKFLGPIRHHNKKEEEEFLDGILKKSKKFFLIMRNEDKKILGGIGFNSFDKVSRKGKLGIALYDEKDLGNGYGTKALKLFLEYSFKYLGLNKVKLDVYKNNPRAIKVYEKCGFRKVGTFRDESYIMGEYIDSVAMEILKKDYKKINK